MKKKILILGGFGFIGNFFYNTFKKKYNILRLGKFSKKKKITLNKLSKIKLKFDIIIDCSGGSSVGKAIENPLKEKEKTLSPIKNIIKYIKKLKNKPIYIYISSAAVYGNSNFNKPSPISNYGKNKLNAEKKLILLSRKAKMKLLIIRFCSVFGNGLKKQLIWDVFCKIKKNSISFFGTGKEMRSWMHISDAVNFIELTFHLSKIGGKIIDAPSKYVMQNKDLIKKILQLAKYKDINPIFNNISKPGDPFKLVTKNKYFKSIKWKQKINLDKGIRAYAAWFQKKYT